MKKKETKFNIKEKATSKPMRGALQVVLQIFRGTFTLSVLLSLVFFVGVWFLQWASVLLMKSTIAGSESVDWMSFVGAWAPPMLFVVIAAAWLVCVITKFVWNKLGKLCVIIKQKLIDVNESE